MNCQAKIQDGFGNKYKCLELATTKLTIKTIVPHLQNKEVTRIRCLCDLHTSRLTSRYNYDIKHNGKKKSYTKEAI